MSYSLAEEALGDGFAEDFARKVGDGLALELSSFLQGRLELLFGLDRKRHQEGSVLLLRPRRSFRVSSGTSVGLRIRPSAFRDPEPGGRHTPSPGREPWVRPTN